MKAVLPAKPASHDASAWWTWPTAIIPVALVGLLLATRVWNAKPKAQATSH
jgi:OPA family glycerol-3-phosphate transporter-like MFS transporter